MPYNFDAHLVILIQPFLCCWCPWTRTDVIKAFWSYLKIVTSRESECAALQVIHRIIIIISKTNRVGPTYAKQLKVQILYYLPVNTGLDYAYIKRSEIYCKTQSQPDWWPVGFIYHFSFNAFLPLRSTWSPLLQDVVTTRPFLKTVYSNTITMQTFIF